MIACVAPVASVAVTVRVLLPGLATVLLAEEDLPPPQADRPAVDDRRSNNSSQE